MQKATALLFTLLLLGTTTALAQDTEYLFEVPMSPDYTAPYSIGEDGGGVHSGARAVAGPYDLDGDGLSEVLVTDYSGGGRVHVIENTGVDTWEWVYSTPVLDSTASVSNVRFVQGADLDGDGMGEIMFISGHGFEEGSDLPLGMYIFENTGEDNDYGDAPASIMEFESDIVGFPPSVVSEQFAVLDVDDDGDQEILVPGNSASDYDIYYIYSVSGDIGTGFEVYVLEQELNPRSDGDTFGGGSPYAIHPADLDGDGSYEISFHSWNYFNFFNADVTAPNEYVFPEPGAANSHLYATFPDDQVSLFAGVVIDMDGDGTEEVYYPNYYTGDVSVLNYESGEDPLQITTDNFIVNMIPGLTSLGIAAGDLDQDGNMDLFGAGPSYSSSSVGDTPTFIRVAEFTGGDVEDGNNYALAALDFWEPFDTLSTNFDLIQRDSAGVMTEYLEETSYGGKDRAGGQPGQGPVFVSKMAFLGDVDGDGNNELAAAFQGVDDSTYVIKETFNPADSTYSREIVEARPVEHRVFMRILEGGPALSIATEDGADVPSGFVLHANYPNPFNPSTSFSFTLPVNQKVSVKIYDVMGRVVQTLVNDEFYSSGTHQVTWNGRNAAGNPVASGTYIYTLEYDNHRQSRVMMLVK